MRRAILFLFAVAGSFACWPAEAWAGMPSVALSDWAVMRVSTISFFLMAFCFASVLIRWLWNGLARDFGLPRLSYGRALAAVALWSMLLAVVLTMIAGSRELLTPGAWQKQGVLYKVADQSQPATTATGSLKKGTGTSQSAETPRTTQDGLGASPLFERKEHLGQLQAALWQYAAQHGGRFPPSDADPAVAAAFWEIPGGGGMHYLYVPGMTADSSNDLLVYEPELDSNDRLVLQANGEIAAASSAEIRRRLHVEKQP